MLSLLTLAFWIITGPDKAPEKPLPEPNSFMQEVRKKLRSDRVLLSQYTYAEKNTAKELDKNGKVKKTNIREFEVYPSTDEELTYRKLVVKDGKRLDEKELAKQDREHTKKFEENERRLGREGEDSRRRRQAKEAEERRKEDAIIDEMFRLYEIRITGRESFDGHDVIALQFSPRPGFKPKSREAGMAAKMKGRAWFGEEDHELVKVEMNLMDDISLGLGLLAKLNKGATMAFTRKRVNDEIWLPAEAHFSGTGRLMLFKGLRIDAVTEYSDYKKFSVETSVQFGAEKK